MIAKGVVPKGKAITRSGAQNGDYLYVTGTLGDAALGLQLVQNKVEISKKHRAHILQRFHYPTARVALGQALRNIASSAMDISDGLAGDLPHILRRSKVGAVVDISKLPMSQALKDSCSAEQALQYALSGGEDYELLFTVPENRRGSLEVLLSPYGVPVTCIGRITGAVGKLEFKQGDIPFAYQHQGFEHF
jgi:thiamine-monophosphate kinase